MAHLRVRARGAGKRYFIRTKAGQELAAGRDLATAKRILHHYRNLEELHRHGIAPPARCDWTLADLAEWDKERRPQAWRRVRWSFLLAQLGASTRLDELTPQVLDAWTRKRLRHVSRRGTAITPATINRNRTFLRAALKRSRSASGFEGDPFAALERLPEAREDRAILTPEDVERFLAVCWKLSETRRSRSTPLGDWQNAAMVELLYRTGSRLNQIPSLRWDQVSDGRIHFPPHKRGIARTFALEERLTRVLEEARSRRVNEYVFGSKASTTGHRYYFRTFWAAACKEAKVAITPHSFRYSAASLWYAEGRNVEEVQQLLGHKTPSMALRLYIRLFPRALPPVLPPMQGQKEAPVSG